MSQETGDSKRETGDLTQKTGKMRQERWNKTGTASTAFWCDRTWPYRSKVWTFSIIKTVLFQGQWFPKKSHPQSTAHSPLDIFEQTNTPTKNPDGLVKQEKNWGKSFVTLCLKARAVDPQSLYADPDPAVFLNADPNPGPGLAKPNLKKKNHE